AELDGERGGLGLEGGQDRLDLRRAPGAAPPTQTKDGPSVTADEAIATAEVLEPGGAGGEGDGQGRRAAGEPGKEARPPCVGGQALATGAHVPAVIDFPAGVADKGMAVALERGARRGP